MWFKLLDLLLVGFCWKRAVGDHLNVGQQYGIIRFGSRVDVWLPATTPVNVLVGQTAIAGESILADLSGKMDEITDGICR